MQAVAFTVIAIAAWLIYCGWTGTPVFATLLDIIKNPGDAQQILSNAPAAGRAETGEATQDRERGTGVVAFARAQIGKPYKLGGAGPDVWDCSGLTMKAYETVNTKLPHSSIAQAGIGKRITKVSELEPGDLVFPSGIATVFGHVQIYSGGGKIIEAAYPGTNVRERDMWGVSGDKVYATRPQMEMTTAIGGGGGGGKGW